MSNALKRHTAASKTARETPSVRVRSREDEVLNNDGGFTFAVSDKDRLERFLILGTEGGTYYVSERKLTRDNAKFVTSLIRKDEALVRDTLVAVADGNRAAKNSPSLFTLALLFTEGTDKAAARAVVPRVARTSTHLFEFAQYLDDLGGWGRAKRKAVAGWYENKDADKLAYQAVKYRQRNGWTHRDLFRLSHPVGVDQNVGNFILGKPEFGDEPVIDGFIKMQKAGTIKEVLNILDAYEGVLPWETIPTQFLKDKRVWQKLFYAGALGQTALLRNVTRFAKLGAFEDMVFAGDVAAALADKDRIVKGRLHPVAYANALGIYRNGPMQGGGFYGYPSRNKDWTTSPKILGALEAGFYESFQTLEPANKATMVSVDVSGSMTWGAPAGLVGMTYMDAAALMAMVFVRTEPYVEVNAFSHKMSRVNVSETDSLQTVLQKFRNVSMGATNIGLPISDALGRGVAVDTFVAITDNEVNCGVKPASLIRKYRSETGRNARYAVIGMAATNFTVADPKDRGMMDFVGFDSAAPRVLADFSAGRV